MFWSSRSLGTHTFRPLCRRRALGVVVNILHVSGLFLALAYQPVRIRQSWTTLLSPLNSPQSAHNFAQVLSLNPTCSLNHVWQGPTNLLTLCIDTYFCTRSLSSCHTLVCRLISVAACLACRACTLSAYPATCWFVVSLHRYPLCWNMYPPSFVWYER